jgi:hypothetical protein
MTWKIQGRGWATRPTEVFEIWTHKLVETSIPYQYVPMGMVHLEIGQKVFLYDYITQEWAYGYVLKQYKSGQYHKDVDVWAYDIGSGEGQLQMF